MQRDRQIDAIVQFVQAHPESLASRAICRRATRPDYYAPADGGGALTLGLTTMDDETLTNLFDLVK